MRKMMLVSFALKAMLLFPISANAQTSQSHPQNCGYYDYFAHVMVRCDRSSQASVSSSDAGNKDSEIAILETKTALLKAGVFLQNDSDAATSVAEVSVSRESENGIWRGRCYAFVAFVSAYKKESKEPIAAGSGRSCNNSREAVRNAVADMLKSKKEIQKTLGWVWISNSSN